MATAKKKITDERTVIEFRGQEFEISTKAFRSMKVQIAARKDATAEWAYDKVCMGHLAEYLERIPEEDGTVDEEYGASEEAFAAFMMACAEAARAKN